MDDYLRRELEVFHRIQAEIYNKYGQKCQECGCELAEHVFGNVTRASPPAQPLISDSPSTMSPPVTQPSSSSSDIIEISPVDSPSDVGLPESPNGDSLSQEEQLSEEFNEKIVRHGKINDEQRVQYTRRPEDYIPWNEKLNIIRVACDSPIIDFVLNLLARNDMSHVCRWSTVPFEFIVSDTQKFANLYTRTMNLPNSNTTYTRLVRALSIIEQRVFDNRRVLQRTKSCTYKFFPETYVFPCINAASRRMVVEVMSRRQTVLQSGPIIPRVSHASSVNRESPYYLPFNLHSTSFNPQNVPVTSQSMTMQPMHPNQPLLHPVQTSPFAFLSQPLPLNLSLLDPSSTVADCPVPLFSENNTSSVPFHSHTYINL